MSEQLNEREREIIRKWNAGCPEAAIVRTVGPDPRIAERKERGDG